MPAWEGGDHRRLPCDDLAEDWTLARVRADARGGLQSGIRGTPSFFVNGKLDVRPWAVILASLPRLSTG